MGSFSDVFSDAISSCLGVMEGEAQTLCTTLRFVIQVGMSNVHLEVIISMW